MTKQLLKHTQPDVLDAAARTLSAFLSAKDLSATNQAKMSELEETLISALRTAAGEDVESASFSEDELHTLAACVARLQKLTRVRNLAVTLEETDGGKETSALDILDGILNRGRLGYKEETAVRRQLSPSSSHDLSLTLHETHYTADGRARSQCARHPPQLAALHRPRRDSLERDDRPSRRPRCGRAATVAARQARGVRCRWRDQHERGRQAGRACRLPLVSFDPTAAVR